MRGDPVRYGNLRAGARTKSDGSELKLEWSISMHETGYAAHYKVARRWAYEARLCW